MPKATVSIALAAYNGSRYIGEQLESFAAQSRLPDELVVCDDGSSDGTPELVERFAARAPFEVRLERNPETLTTTPNFEKAVSLCRGDLVFLSDQDDVWLPEKIEEMADYLESHPDAGGVVCNGAVCDANADPLGYDLWEAQWFTPAEQRLVRDGRTLEVFVNHVVASGNTFAFRARFLDLVLPFPEIHDCADAWIATLIAAVSQVHILDRELIRYRLHEENQIGNRRFSFRDQIQMARWQIEAGIFSHGERLYGAMEGRLCEPGAFAGCASEASLALIRGKTEHSRVRDGMTGNFFARLPGIAREIINRGYWRYSYGAKSVAQDLFLR
ncbi:MAG: glycosyltransferase family 2 protein [Myxococcota bacterium]|nr:glycosyltransferase family 2 protein [Myxococcota bacterium]